MNGLIDLMPASCRKRLGHKRRVRRWAFLLGATAAAIIVTESSLSIIERGDRKRVAALQSLVELNADQRRRADAIRIDIATINRKINRYEQLVWPVDFGDVISIIGRLTPPEVSLESLSIVPKAQRRRFGASRSKLAAASNEGRELIVELSGVAPNDFQMADLVRGLENHPLFSKVGVNLSRKTSINDVEAREFGVSCVVDLSKRYVIADVDDREVSP